MPNRVCIVLAFTVLPWLSNAATATAECPCINPWVNLTNASFYNEVDNCLETGTDNECVPITFGASECSDHTNALSICLDGTSNCDDPEFCTSLCDSPWCYVDPNNCETSPYLQHGPFFTGPSSIKSST